MPVRIENGSMFLEVDGRDQATPRCREEAATDGHGAWIISRCPARLLTRSQAIADLTVEEMR